MENFNKTVCLGRGPGGAIFITITFKNGNLSITGVEGPKNNGDCLGSCGQIDNTIRKYKQPLNDYNGHVLPKETIDVILSFWERWHLNDMRPGCEHQRALGWSDKPIDDTKPTNAYGLHFEGQTHPSWNLLGWVSEEEHPNGLLSKPCPICGYKYGTAWKREEVPEYVIEFFKNLPSINYKIGKWFD